MRTEDVIKLFGTASSVARFLGIKRSAISQWPEEVPKLRQYELREMRPEIDSELAALKERAA